MRVNESCAAGVRAGVCERGVQPAIAWRKWRRRGFWFSWTLALHAVVEAGAARCRDTVILDDGFNDEDAQPKLLISDSGAAGAHDIPGMEYLV